MDYRRKGLLRYGKKCICAVLMAVSVCALSSVGVVMGAASANGMAPEQPSGIPPEQLLELSSAERLVQIIEEGKAVAASYQAYEERFEQIQLIGDITAMGYEVVEKHVFDIPLVAKMLDEEGEFVDTEVVRPAEYYRVSEEDELAYQKVPTVRFYTAIDSETHRAAVFLADKDGQIVYKNNLLECNYTALGQVEQPIVDMVSVAFQDLNHDGLTDIILIAGCMNTKGSYIGKQYKVGEVLFQSDNGDAFRNGEVSNNREMSENREEMVDFYRDWRINDKINRFDMNKSAKCIRSFVRDGRSTEFLYTATTEAELLNKGFEVIEEQSYWRNYEKLGRLKVLPGVYSMADYDVFMIYMINEQGNIVWCFQPMGDFDNLYSLRGISGKDLDGDGMKDLLVVGRYSKEGENGEIIVEGQYSIYYQRTGGFDTDTEFALSHPYDPADTVEALVDKIHAYWGWNTAELVEKKVEKK